MFPASKTFLLSSYLYCRNLRSERWRSENETLREPTASFYEFNLQTYVTAPSQSLEWFGLNCLYGGLSYKNVMPLLPKKSRLCKNKKKKIIMCRCSQKIRRKLDTCTNYDVKFP